MNWFRYVQPLLTLSGCVLVLTSCIGQAQLDASPSAYTESVSERDQSAMREVIIELQDELNQYPHDGADDADASSQENNGNSRDATRIDEIKKQLFRVLPFYNDHPLFIPQLIAPGDRYENLKVTDVWIGGGASGELPSYTIHFDGTLKVKGNLGRNPSYPSQYCLSLSRDEKLKLPHDYRLMISSGKGWSESVVITNTDELIAAVSKQVKDFHPDDFKLGDFIAVELTLNAITIKNTPTSHLNEATFTSMQVLD